ncbi:hypothetical protein PFMC_03458 [Plasmodium falciparum CAMP/Malaysia]|uniref:Uncharacterized protein n=1 Tax=Plasmodium falciparum (isolate Camp / Malaysia) TaxID=5835 RepID=A0A024X6F3_PLAFC|nr:hypothetical protein PFMC_03458 [Plasmodium falciparum CAMP/Malaysia]
MLVCIYGMFIMPYKNKHLPNIIYIFLHLFCIIEHKRKNIIYYYDIYIYIYIYIYFYIIYIYIYIFTCL